MVVPGNEFLVLKSLEIVRFLGVDQETEVSDVEHWNRLPLGKRATNKGSRDSLVMLLQEIIFGGKLVMQI